MCFFPTIASFMSYTDLETKTSFFGSIVDQEIDDKTLLGVSIDRICTQIEPHHCGLQDKEIYPKDWRIRRTSIVGSEKETWMIIRL